MNRLINRTNEPGTCPWCGEKLRVWTRQPIYKEARNPNFEKEMRAWEDKMAEAHGTLKENFLRHTEPPSVLREFVGYEKVSALNPYAPFCSLRCGHAFGRAAYKNDFRLQPYTETEEQS